MNSNPLTTFQGTFQGKQMNLDYFIQLCFGTYKVADIFPKSESLKFKIKELANEILANLILINKSSIPAFYSSNPDNPDNQSDGGSTSITLREIETLQSYFRLAKRQNWVDSRNFLVLEREYNKIKEELEQLKRILVFGEKEVKEFNLTQKERQKRILEILKKKEKIRLGELSQIFSDVHSRTLIRDLEKLKEAGLIQKSGERKAAYYTITDIDKRQAQLT